VVMADTLDLVSILSHTYFVPTGESV
jgi:hypothetical protein